MDTIVFGTVLSFLGSRLEVPRHRLLTLGMLDAALIPLECSTGVESNCLRVASL